MLSNNEKQKILAQLTVVSNELNEIQYSLEGMQDLSELVKTISGKVKDGFKGFSKTITGIENGIKSYIENTGRISLIKDIDKSHKEIKSLTESVPFERVYKMSAINVPGVKDNVSNLSTLNFIVIDHITKNILNELKIANKDLSRFMSNKEAKVSFKKLDKNYVEMKSFSDKNKKEYSKFINPNDINDVRQVKDIVGNGKKVVSLFENLIKTNELLPDKKLEHVDSEVNKLKKKVDHIYDSLVDNEDAISKVALNNLIEGVSICADYISMFSSSYYIHIKSMETAMDIHRIYKKYK